MKFEKRNFMGIELDVLVGHPEHELLFIGAQVAAAAGLENATGSLGNFRQSKACTLKLSIGDVIVPYSNRVGEVPKAHNGRAYHAITSLLDEANVYKMLMRSRAPQTEPFRKWVTEEVLPTIRKTGKYDAEQSTNPIAQGLLDQLRAVIREELSREFAQLRSGISETLNGVAKAPESPYEGVTKGTVWYHKDKAAIRKAGETLRLSVPVTDKYTPHLLIQLEKNLIQKWKAEDGRALDSEFSVSGNRNWTLWPMPYLRAFLTHPNIVEALTMVINERLNK